MIFSSRSTTMASVGVCTRPTVVRWNPPSRELKAVMARVPLMPTSQSAAARQAAALASGWSSTPSRRRSKPSRMAPGVMDCSQRRWMGRLDWAYCAICRKISSPSRPASQALIRQPTSLRRMSRSSNFRRAAVLSIGCRSKCGGMTGRFSNFHLPRGASQPSGGWISSRWPIADESTYFSLSK